MLVLVLNAGSSSLKYQLIEMDNESVLAQGNCERIGIDGRIVHKFHGEKHVFEKALPTHFEALNAVVSLISEGELAAVKSLSEIKAVGHRIAQGGEGVDKSMLINDDVLAVIEKSKELAPLHVPAMLSAIDACKKIFGGDIAQVAVFDTAFHQTMPKKAFIYPIPYEYYEKHGIRRFGYHGTSHKFVSKRLAQVVGGNLSEMKIVTCHLGNGSSVTAIKNGKSIDTTMGYTPLEGLLMGTRCGTIDPSIPFLLARKENLSLDEVEAILNKKSGCAGVSGVSSDDRDVQEAADNGNERAALALDILRYQIKKYIGAYAAAMEGIDAIAFTGGIGEKSWQTRRDVCKGLEFLGVKLDEQLNKSLNGEEAVISTPDSKVKVCIIPTNEELEIARDTLALAN